jgi:hypothetical protein
MFLLRSYDANRGSIQLFSGRYRGVSGHDIRRGSRFASMTTVKLDDGYNTPAIKDDQAETRHILCEAAAGRGKYRRLL